MAKFTVKQEDGLFVIVDGNGEFIEAFDSKLEALRVAREYNTPAVSPVRKIEGRYGYGETVTAAVEVEAVEEPAAKVEIVIAAKPAKPQTKAEQVRACIAQVKQQGGNIAAVVEWAVAQLGMPKTQAMTYAKNNWHKA